MMVQPKLLIFGGSGFVGENLAEMAVQQGWDTVIANPVSRPTIEKAGWSKVDITQNGAVDQAIHETQPSAVVNAAALADIDRAEREQALAWQVNVEGARRVADACARQAIRHVFFSSDAVFDGEGGPYSEGDEKNPLNYYGFTKAEAEKAVLGVCPGAVVIRLSLVLGFPVTVGNSFLVGLEAKLRAGDDVTCPIDEVRTPVDVLTLGECVLELLTESFEGLLHIGCTENVNRYDLTCKITQQMGFPVEMVQPLTSHLASSGRAPRHKNGILDISSAQRVLKTPLLDLDETICRAIAT
jgi:dTDP-4-dehydrorhamnose reductase